MRFREFAQEKLGALRQLGKNVRRLVADSWKRHPGVMVTLGAIAAATSVAPFVRTGATAFLINSIADPGTRTLADALPAILVLLASSLIPDVLLEIKGFVDKKFWIYTLHETELRYARKMADIDVATHEDPKFKDLENRASENFYSAANLLGMQFNTVQNTVSLVSATVILLVFSPLIFVVMFLGLLPSFYVEARYGKDIWGIYDAKAEDRRRFYDLKGRFSHLTELIELKLFRNVGKIFGLITKLLEDFNSEQIKVERRKLWLKLGSTSVAVCAVGFSLVWAVLMALRGEIEVGTMTFVLATVASFGGTFSAFLYDIARQLSFSLFVTDILAVLDTKNRIKSPAKPARIDAARAPEIVFENVSFKYPGTDRHILRNFSLKVAAGEKLAIVGVNGAGKTTFVKLLCRFYDPTEGRILVNGVDLRKLDLGRWYDMLAVLFQDYATYQFLVKEGIAMGRSSKPLDMGDVRKAAEASDSHAFIDQWEKKYEQMIGKNFAGGVEVSRGQQQKLALARSFYREPKVLVLDEPTASVDAEAEAKIFERLEETSREATVILISHRFSTVRKADKICVIEDGVISELGTHEELLASPKTYARLFELQARGYKE